MIPPRVILAPVDFSEPSRTSLQFAVALARHTGAALHVLHAQDPLLAEGARHAGFDLARDTEEELGRFVADASPESGAAPHAHVATGPAVDVIVQTAQDLGADLVVVGSHGISGAERLVFGSTTEGLLRRARTSVLVMPARSGFGISTVPDMSSIGPVIAALDFSTQAIEAAKAACQLGVALNTTVEVVHVVPDVPALMRWRVHSENAVRGRVTAARDRLETVTGSLGCQAPPQVKLETGDVALLLAEAAASSSTRRPILVLGRRRPGEKGGAPGSTAYRVLLLAKVPVLMHVADDHAN
jgi:nucleotide-binding universal stress UspA family protein